MYITDCSMMFLSAQTPAGCNWKLSPLDVSVVKEITAERELDWFLADVGQTRSQETHDVAENTYYFHFKSFDLILRWFDLPLITKKPSSHQLSGYFQARVRSNI